MSTTPSPTCPSPMVSTASTGDRLRCAAKSLYGSDFMLASRFAAAAICRRICSLPASSHASATSFSSPKTRPRLSRGLRINRYVGCSSTSVLAILRRTSDQLLKRYHAACFTSQPPAMGRLSPFPRGYPSRTTGTGGTRSRLCIRRLSTIGMPVAQVSFIGN